MSDGDPKVLALTVHDALFAIARALNLQQPLFCFDLETRASVSNR